MFTKIYFPIANTHDINFDSDINMSRKDYNNMIISNFEKNKQTMEDFEKHGFSARKNIAPKNNDIHDAKDYIEYSEAEAILNLFDSDKELNDSIINEYSENEKMLLLTVNINPNSIEYDTWCEIKEWVSESSNINNDNTLDNKSKISLLPSRNIKIKLLDNSEKMLTNCKVLKDCSTKNLPLNIIIIVEKITF